ncbi:MAG: restriction endonuclease subunit S [Clostridia bacterium]|nr:restriction endonuclease subunit S [Clostridia bacterium]
MKIKLGDLTRIKTGKLDANASSPDGKYPFFTCSREPLRINSYSYDCECVLVAGNGDLNVKYYNGKFDAYQRTYIIEENGAGKLFLPYLYYFLDGYVEELRKLSIGGVIKYIKLGNLTDALIELPDIQSQRAIVDILAKAKGIIDIRKQELQSLEDLIKARFIELFGDPITNDKGWDVVELNSVCDGIGDGLHGTPEYDDSGEYPFINGNNLMNGVIEITPATKMVNEDTYKKHFIELTKNAILLSINGTLGKLAFYNGENVMLGKSACYCNLKSEINREFVYGVMTTDAFARFLESNATASTIKNVGLKAIRGFKLILPPENLQNQFVEFSKQVDKSKAVIQKALDKTQLLFDSLMQEYFG